MRTRPTLLAVFAVLGLAVVATAQDTKPESPKPRPEDVKSIDAIIAALYDTISGPVGAKRDWDRFRSLFAPDARLIPVSIAKDGQARPRTLTVEDFIQAVGPATKDVGFFESEIHRKTETFDVISHVFSTYESRHEKDGKPFVRGINSIQLVKVGDSWRVVSIYWGQERPESPLPAEYLPQPKP